MEPLNEGFNPDHLAFNIHCGIAAVARVNQSIGLDEILIHGPAFKAVDDIRTALGADMAKSYAEIEAKRCADGDSDFFFSSRRRHTRFKCDWSSDVCSSD